MDRVLHSDLPVSHDGVREVVLSFENLNIPVLEGIGNLLELQLRLKDDAIDSPPQDEVGMHLIHVPGSSHACIDRKLWAELPNILFSKFKKVKMRCHKICHWP